MKMRQVLTLMLLAGITAFSAIAQKKDLSGTWTLNLAKSFLGGDHPASDYQLTRKIEQKDATLSITDSAIHVSMMNIPMPDSTSTMSFTVDGKAQDVQLPPPFPGMPAAKAKMSAVWEGCTLAIHMSQGAGGSTKQRLFLSEDGSELIVLVEGHSTFYDSEQRLVFDRKI